MARTRIYTDQELRSGDTVSLAPDASAHLIRVLRLHVGDALTVFNGRGGEYSATLTQATPKACQIQLGEFREGLGKPREIHLVQGISRGERMDFTLQKAVELGATRIVPVHCLRSVAKLKGERAEKRSAHWHGVIISACEQSGRCDVPELAPISDFNAALADAHAGMRLILSVDGAVSPGELQAPLENQPITLVAGPEGGFDPRESEQASQLGYQALKLGPRVLRTETAALAAISLIQTRWGDFL